MSFKMNLVYTISTLENGQNGTQIHSTEPVASNRRTFRVNYKMSFEVSAMGTRCTITVTL